MSRTAETADLVVIGAGAAGLMTGITCARAAPGLRVVCVDGAKRVGAKILVSGGARCNVTNREVVARDFWGGSSRIVDRILRAFPAERAAGFFVSLGVTLHEEDDGKLFPDTNKARTVLDALLAEIRARSVTLREGLRVSAMERDGRRFRVVAGDTAWSSRAVVLATGGRSLPKSGSDGFGYTLAHGLGHGQVETTPALAPLILDDDFHARLSGVAHPADITLRARGMPPVRLSGPLLWTHFGASGPVVLNASRHWHRAIVEGRSIDVLVNVCPGETFETLEFRLLRAVAERPKASIATALASLVPAAVATVWLERAGVASATVMSHLSRDDRRRLVHALTATPLSVRDSRGYTHAEVTAGGVPLDEIDPATMESRKCAGLYLVGEILDVDGRLGGFNFQWAWSSGYVAGTAIARALGRPEGRPLP